MTRRTSMLSSRNLGDISAPTPTHDETKLYHARLPSTLTFKVCVQDRPTKKKRMPFTDGPPLYTVFQLDADSSPLYLNRPIRRGQSGFTAEQPKHTVYQFDAIGTMHKTYFLVDCISASDQDGMTVTFPPLMPGEARDLARIAQKILSKQIAPKRCRPIGPDILDIETLAT